MIEVLKQMVEALENERQTYEATDSETGAPYNILEAIQAGRQAIAELENQYAHGMYGAEDLNKAWKSGYDNCKDQYAYLDKQEPVAWADHGVVNWITDKQFKHPSLLYAHPPQRTWVGLTPEERSNCRYWACEDYATFGRAIETKLKQKNGYAEGQA